jgi:hypothetical protein
MIPPIGDAIAQHDTAKGLPNTAPELLRSATRRLVAVSNRVTSTGGAKPDSGGLAVAIRSALQESGGVWFGWSGEVVEEPTDEPGIAVDGPLTFATLDLSPRDYDEYYVGYAHPQIALGDSFRRFLDRAAALPLPVARSKKIGWQLIEIEGGFRRLADVGVDHRPQVSSPVRRPTPSLERR